MCYQAPKSIVWYLDPLDGTLNYAHGLPIYAVSIAYEENGQVLLGVVYDPERDECFSTEHGRGAWLNGVRLEGPSAQDLDHSLLVTGFPYDIRTNPANNLDHYAAFALRSYGVRRLGSAAIDLCYIAAGRVDGYLGAAHQLMGYRCRGVDRPGNRRHRHQHVPATPISSPRRARSWLPARRSRPDAGDVEEIDTDNGFWERI